MLEVESQWLSKWRIVQDEVGFSESDLKQIYRIERLVLLRPDRKNRNARCDHPDQLGLFIARLGQMDNGYTPWHSLIIQQELI